MASQHGRAKKCSPASARSRSASTGHSSGGGNVNANEASSREFRLARCRRLLWDAGHRSSQQPPAPPEGKEGQGKVELRQGEDGAAAAAGIVPSYSQMPMRAFLSHKDWRELITRRNSGKLAKDRNSGNKYNRMLYSHHRLYQEYQYLCTCLLPRSGCVPGDSGVGADGGCGDRCKDEHLESDAVEADGANGEAAMAIAAVDTAAAAAAASAFGSVLMSDQNFKVECCKKRRSVVCHRVLTRSTDGATVWLDVPIAVELLLPRLQEQIKAVMSACPHVPDPLEVLAELRANRYDTERCVDYLRETMPLREVVRDILSAQSGRCLDAARAAADRRDLRCRIAGLEAQLKSAAAQLLLDGSGVSGGGGNIGGGNIGSGGDDDPLSGRVRRLVASLDAVKSLLNTEGISPRRQPRRKQPLAAMAGGDAVPPAEEEAERPLLRGLRQLRDDLQVVRASLQSVAAAMSTGLNKVCSHLTMQQQERSHRCKDTGAVAAAAQQQATVSRLQKYIEELRLKCKEEEGRRRQVFNALQEQLGNIRVYCRCTRIDGDQAVETVGAESVRVRGHQQDEFFRFDRVFGPDAPQESLFEELKPLITSFLDGYNVCFITYGGEASGKTFTLLGSSRQRGLVHRALLAVLNEAANREADWELELDSACLEIYNDACFDLLADRAPVSLYKDCSLSSVFSALQRAPILAEQDVTELLRACAFRRRVAKTALNPRSSRSHLVHLVRLQARSRVHGHTACSYLAMMDLAGAENIVKADTWRDPERSAEAGHINRSLAAFNRLFLTLRRTPPSAACYREARLTQMLKPFLVNHGKCCIIVTVRTDQGSISTTMSTLRFGRDARHVALGKAQRQLVSID